MGARQCKRPLVDQQAATSTCLPVTACHASSCPWLGDSGEDRGLLHPGIGGAAAAARASDGSRPKSRRTSAAHPPPALLLRAGPSAGKSEPGSWPSAALGCCDPLFGCHAAAAVAAGGASHDSVSIDGGDAADNGDSTCFGAGGSEGLLQLDGRCGFGGGSSLGRGGRHPGGAAAGSSDDDEWAEFTTTQDSTHVADDEDDGTAADDDNAGDPLLVDALLSSLHGAQLLGALAALELLELHPVGAGGYSSLEVTVAGVLVLCQRANVGVDELTPELLLTLLWILESTGSQYRCSLNSCLSSYLLLHPHCVGAEYDELKSGMHRLQLQVLQRCNWRVLLLDEAPLQEALAALSPRPAFASACALVRRCAEARCIVSPVAPGPSPGTAALLAALGGCSVGNGGSDDEDDDDVEDACGLHPRAAAAAAATRFPAARGCAGLSSGLDGSYWLMQQQQQEGALLQPGPPSKRATRSGRQVRVLAPRNA